MHDGQEPIAVARRLIEDECVMLCFPPPTIGQGLARWADEVLDIPLAPRGSPIWARGHAHTIDALEAALRWAREGHEGSKLATRAHIRAAKEIVFEHGRTLCVCAMSGAAFLDVVGRRRCIKCLARLQ